LYSTFLTRSGVLGDASVHSFTDLGLTGQLLLFLFFFMALPVFLVLPKRQRFVYLIASITLLAFGFSSQFSSISNALWTLFGLLSFGLGIFSLNQRINPNTPSLEENVWSRDFWMLMGALVLTVSALHLTVETSKPVINKLTGTSMAVGDVAAYNAVQWWFGLLLSIGMGVVLYLMYGKKTAQGLAKELGRVALVAVAFTLVSFSLYPNMKVMPDALLLLGGWFALASGFLFVAKFIKKHPLAAGGGLAHAGFGLLMVGIVISMGQQQNVSKNQNEINLKALNEEFSNDEHVMLMKGDSVRMASYTLVFANDTLNGSFAEYQIDYYSLSDGKNEKKFSLNPRIILSPSMGNVAEPATRHFLTHDVFTHITYVDLENLKRKSAGIAGPEYEEPQHFELKIGDTVYSSNAYIVVEGIASDPRNAQSESDPNNLNLNLYPTFTVRDLQGNIDTVKPAFLIQGLSLKTIPDTAKGNGLVIEVKKINPKTSTIEVEMQRKKYQNQDDFIIMKAVIFPWIKLLWAGCFLIAIGSLMAVAERFKKNGQA
jgi:cytochrome c-type biogenesis protein CcmF